MKILTKHLSGPSLDWAVAKAEGHTEDCNSWLYKATVSDVRDSGSYHPSERWDQAGPIIEREQIGTEPSGDALKWRAHVWNPDLLDFTPITYGPTVLVAAMRCLVAMKIGGSVDVPEE